MIIYEILDNILNLSLINQKIFKYGAQILNFYL